MDAEELAELEETFHHFDADKNGTIDQKEFLKLLVALDAGIEEDEASIGFQIIDADGNGHIDFDEFVSWWTDDT